MKFCEVCNNILYIETSNKIKFSCKICLNEIDGDESDTLIFDVKMNNEEELFIKYATFINLAAKDNTLSRVEMPCENESCPETIMKYAILGDSMQFIYICETCDYRFIK